MRTKNMEVQRIAYLIEFCFPLIKCAHANRALRLLILQKPFNQNHFVTSTREHEYLQRRIMRGVWFIFIVALLLCVTADIGRIWDWQCDQQKSACTRVRASSTRDPQNYPTLEVCRLVCGQYSGLWPMPTRFSSLDNDLFKFPLKNIQFNLPNINPEINEFLENNTAIFLETLRKTNTDNCSSSSNIVSIIVTINTDNTKLDWSTDESYRLNIRHSNSENLVKINANTIFGARHALTTLTQLIEIYMGQNEKCLVTLNHVEITDGPVYPHRGLLIDSSRNFLSLSVIKKQLDGMAVSKLNVLHWHITDSQSFPLAIQSVPQLAQYGAYNEALIYHPQDVADIIAYARLRGIRVIIEIDSPSHSGFGWQWGPEENLGNIAVCVNKQPWRMNCIEPPCGQINPINSNVFEVFKRLYKDIMDMLPQGEILHMGGDEVYIPCWNSTEEILDWLGDKPRTTETFLQLWSDFQAKALQAFDDIVGNSQTPVILWTSHLTEPDMIQKYLPKDRYVIQTWVPSDDDTPEKLVNLGYRLVISTKDAWYLDHGFWGTTTYHNWDVVYNNRILTDNKVMGGEVCMWGEYVDDYSLDTKIWPRAAAAAERLWTNPDQKSTMARSRFFRHRERLVYRGLNADAVIPKWCYQNEGQCD